MTTEDIKKEIQDRIKIMEAYLNGDVIEYKDKGGNHWICLDKFSEKFYYPNFDFQNYSYRIKSTPRKLWVAIYKKCKDIIFYHSFDEEYIKKECSHRDDVEIVSFIEDIK